MGSPGEAWGLLWDMNNLGGSGHLFLILPVDYVGLWVSFRGKKEFSSLIKKVLKPQIGLAQHCTRTFCDDRNILQVH